MESKEDKQYPPSRLTLTLECSSPLMQEDMEWTSMQLHTCLITIYRLLRELSNSEMADTLELALHSGKSTSTISFSLEALKNTNTND